MVLTGWAFHIPRLKGLISGQVPVKANTAVCYVLIGTALWLVQAGNTKRYRQVLSGVLATAVSVVGLLSFLEYWYGWDLGIDQLLFTAGPEDLQGSVRPGLMSPIAALDFFLLGITISLLDVQELWSRWIQALFAGTVVIASVFGILDFVLDPGRTHTHIAPLTAMILFLFAFAVLCARPGWGLGRLLVSVGADGELSRRMLPAAILIPLVVGWLCWKGQESDLYSRWAGLVIMVTTTGALLTGLTLWTAVVLDRVGRERAKAEASAQRLASIVMTSNDAIIGKTLEGIVTSWNAGAEAIYGYSAQEMMGQSFSRLIPLDRREEFQGFLQRLRNGETIRHYETQRTRKDGKTISVSVATSPLKDEKGRIVGASTIARDITERKRAEEELRRVSLYSRSLIEASLDPLVTISKDGKITDVNEATEEATGRPRRQLIGSDFSDYFTEPDKARAGYQQVFERGFVRDYLLAIRNTSGAVMEVLYNATVFKDANGEVEGVFAAARDVTGLRRAEQDLRLSRERLALAQKAAHSGTFDWDIQANINLWTPEVEEVHGLAPGGFGGKYEDWEALVLPEDLPAAKARIKDSLKTGEFAGEWRIRRRNDGQIRWITARAKVIFDDQGKPSRMLGLNMDVTERKQAEEQVQRLNEELEQRVIQRTFQLEAANKELEAFTYSVSHDLRAPLRHISGFSRILAEEFSPHLPPDAQHHVQRIQEGTRRMGQLVDDLLNLGRVGRKELSLQVAGLRSIADDVIQGLKPDVGDRQVEWKIGDLPYVECDPALLQQVFQNLLSNALKFTGPRSHAVIEIGQEQRDGKAVVYVRDNGVGFSMKYADKLFGVFQRLHRAEDFEGTGVGLATVQRIIEKHGGRVWAEAELDKGASFYFTLGNSQNREEKSKAMVAGENHA